MKKIIQATVLGAMLAGLGWTDPSVAPMLQPTVPIRPAPRLVNLIQNLPDVGFSAESKALGLATAFCRQPPGPPSQNASSYTLLMPGDLDRRSTDAPPFKGLYPGLHLNMPLKVQPSYVNYLFISDQPERIADDRKRTPSVASSQAEPGPGATGVYARSPIPAGSTTRSLVDHTNGTKRPLRFWLVWIPEKDGFLSVRKRSQSVHKDSVAAGSNSFRDKGQVTFEPRQTINQNEGVPLVSVLLQPGETVVIHLEHFCNVAGQLAAVVGEETDLAPASLAALDTQPVLHSIVWKEEQERLGKFIDPNADPTRYKRISSTFQHARGHFPNPDRIAEVSYKAPTFKETDYPMQVFSLFESIPGVDVTVRHGEKSAATDNRGKYGARVGLKLNLEDLPQGCEEVALLAYNRGDVFGGRHWVSDGKRTAFETYLRSGQAPGLLKKGQVCTLWRGKVKQGDTLTMWTEPMANTSVQLWYLVVPIPPAAPSS